MKNFRGNGNRLFKVKCAVLAASVMLTSFSLCGCFQTRPPRVTHAHADDEVKPGSPTEASPTPTATPTPDPKIEAVKLAKEAGLTEKDLKGQYALFERYYEVVSSNQNLSGYREFIYHLFPIIADHLKSENEEYFFDKVGSLKITEHHTNGIDGQYIQSENRVEVEPDLTNKLGEGAYSAVLYHELMHFIDLNIAGNEFSRYLALLDDGTIHRYCDLTYPERGRIKSYLYTYFTEGGAEMYTSEYFTYAPNSYLVRVRFLVAMKYIFGAEKVDDMFFAGDTDYQFYELLKANEFTDEEIVKLFTGMKNSADALKEPKSLIDPREALIRLYIKNIGPDYEKDKTFCRILGTMNFDQDLNKIPSDYSKFYQKQTGIPQEVVVQIWGYVTNYVGNYDVQWGFVGTPGPLYLDGQLKVVIMAAPMSGDMLDYKSFVSDYEFEKDELKDCTLYDNWMPAPIEGSSSGSTTGTSTSGSDETTETT